MRPIWDCHLVILRTAPFTLLPQVSSWLPTFPKLSTASWLYFALFSLFFCSHVIAICPSEPSCWAWVGFRGSSMRLFRQYNASYRTLPIPRWEHYENCNLYGNSLFQQNKYSVPNLMQCIWVLCLEVLGVCIPEWIILNSFRWEGMEELTWHSFVFLSKQKQKATPVNPWKF